MSKRLVSVIGGRMSPELPPLFARLGMAVVCFFKILFQPRFAKALLPLYRPSEDERSATEAPPSEDGAAAQTERAFAPALFILGALQKEGRLIDFLEEEIAGASDSDVGAAARIVHAGCRKVLKQYLLLEPVLQESEGTHVTVPKGFSSEHIRLTGNVQGQPPFAGALRHHGWLTRKVIFPTLSLGMDPRVLAPAEVELS
jgi:hypothetical protein